MSFYAAAYTYTYTVYFGYVYVCYAMYINTYIYLLIVYFF